MNASLSYADILLAIKRFSSADAGLHTLNGCILSASGSDRSLALICSWLHDQSTACTRPFALWICAMLDDAEL